MTTPAQAPPARVRETASPVDDDVLTAIETAMVRIRRRQSRRSLARPVAEEMPEPIDLNTLAVIDAVDEGAARPEQPVTVGFVADRLAIDPSRASRLVTAAVKSGHVLRVASQEDGRRSCLELTDTGRAAVSAAHHTRQQFYARLLEGWPEEEQREFARLLDKFVHSLDTVRP
ncbi:MarR family transcriptional regulator [Streptomyces alkaliphilus]|uniref:MarR family transcriptional regulator n=1 Tax=Streptomyces alkaliphilus TaxID=1472722 RepID=A0A7W3Y1A4_9ACTN|nr:MarR family winged helix-turn-helix transcriptional regulator [Streptomyces alkaliphilus]MBB0244060.1 MarR family transcriptional regulator [Streptomyces alkaliphilus]